MGRRATVLKASFEDVDDVVRLGAEAIEFLGGIDCLVNNSGITFNKPFLKITPEQYDTVFNVNIRAQFFLTQHVVQHMVKNGGGAIVNLTSIHGVQGAPEHAVYAATKGRDHRVHPHAKRRTGAQRNSRKCDCSRMGDGGESPQNLSRLHRRGSARRR